jgi:hypothetical protein
MAKRKKEIDAALAIVMMEFGFSFGQMPAVPGGMVLDKEGMVYLRKRVRDALRQVKVRHEHRTANTAR